MEKVIIVSGELEILELFEIVSALKHYASYVARAHFASLHSAHIKHYTIFVSALVSRGENSKH